MAIAANELTTNHEGSGAGSSSESASIAPADNAIVLGWILDEDGAAGGAPGTQSMSGGGMTTWDQVATVTLLGNSDYRLSCFRAQEASPGSGTCTMNGDADIDYRYWSIVEFTGVTVGSNGADAIVQSDTNSVHGPDGNVTVAASLAALGATGNRVAGGCITNHQAFGDSALEAGLTQLAITSDGDWDHRSFWRDDDTPDLSPSVSTTGGFGDGSDGLLIAVELELEVIVAAALSGAVGG